MVARAVFRNHENPLEWIARTDSFSRGLLETSRILAADLKAIALLMGHAPPLTTCHHYLHVLDWFEVHEKRLKDLLR